MRRHIIGALALGCLAAAPASAGQQAADRHPDLSGGWAYAIDLAPAGLKKVVDGKTTTVKFDQNARHRVFDDVPGARPWTKAPSYKPEFQAKVADLAAHESQVDGVFYCGRPGVPRIGSPRRIIQLPGEFVFLYEEISGNTFRIIPIDGRTHRPGLNPSYYGDGVGHWEGDTLVVDTVNFVDESWFGEDGYFHSDAMHVIERFWRIGDQLAFQVTVDDPKVLTQPWTNFPHLIDRSNEPLEEAPACKEDDGHRLLNLDHHLQR